MKKYFLSNALEMRFLKVVFILIELLKVNRLLKDVR